MPTAIKFENISKQYRLGLVSTRTLSHDLNRWWQTNIRGKEDPYLTIGSVNDRSTKADSDYVWALRDINFEVEQGDVVGIIGKNGAGKSTLLKILSKVTAPTTGTIKAKGRIASLLEIGTGFHPEMTGRENIYMNGAIMGMTKSEINRKFDEIVDFSGVERYIDTPVKRYSSGMTVRLGVAVAAFLEPEILVVDEVLAVGDAEFQKKAIGKMQNISHGDGRTVLFVSHNMDSMLNLCHKGILLQNGSIKFTSDIQDAVNYYLGSGKVEGSYHCEENSKPIYVSNVEFTGTKDNILGLFRFEESICLNISIKRKETFIVDDKCILGLILYSQNRSRVCTLEFPLVDINRGKEITIDIKLPNKLLSPGKYFLETGIHIPNVQIFEAVSDICKFTIFDTGTRFLKYNGVYSGYVIIDPVYNCTVC